MRIVSGTHKGRRFTPPKGLPVRPTTDFAKEGLFNMLRSKIDIDGTKVLDLCAGTGNMTFEFASRGAQSVLAVEQHNGCVRFIQQTAEALQLAGIMVMRSEIYKFLSRNHQTYDIVFADPPYAEENTAQLPDLIFKQSMLAEDGLLIVEHGRNTSFEEHPHFLQTRKFGNVNFTFFENS